MASGSQDWIQRSDMYVQTLSEMAARIKTGFNKTCSFHGAVNAGEDTEMFSVTGKGLVLGESAWVEDTARIDYNYFYGVADGEVLGDWPVMWHRKYANVLNPATITLYRMIDDVNFRYGWNLAKNVSFEQSFKVYYHEAHGRTPTVRCDAVVGLF